MQPEIRQVASHAGCHVQHGGALDFETKPLAAGHDKEIEFCPAVGRSEEAVHHLGWKEALRL